MRSSLSAAGLMLILVLLSCASKPKVILVGSHVLYLANTYSVRQSGRVCLVKIGGHVHNRGYYLASSVWRMADLTEYVFRELTSIGLTVYRDDNSLCRSSDLTVGCTLKELETKCLDFPLIMRCSTEAHFTCRLQSRSRTDEYQYNVRGQATNLQFVDDDTTIFGGACSEASGQLASELVPDVVRAFQ